MSKQPGKSLQKLLTIFAFNVVICLLGCGIEPFFAGFILIPFVAALTFTWVFNRIQGEEEKKDSKYWIVKEEDINNPGHPHYYTITEDEIRKSLKSKGGAYKAQSSTQYRKTAHKSNTQYRRATERANASYGYDEPSWYGPEREATWSRPTQIDWYKKLKR